MTDSRSNWLEDLFARQSRYLVAWLVGVTAFWIWFLPIHASFPQFIFISIFFILIAPVRIRFRRRRPPSEEEEQWRRRRILFRLVVVLTLAPPILYFGSNYIVFGRLTHPGPDDFIPQIEAVDIPIVRAIKEYYRDHGQYPEEIKDLIPAYYHGPEPFSCEIEQGPAYTYYIHYFENWETDIIYPLEPAHGAWSAQGMLVSGPISLPPVTIAPATNPTTRPN